MGALVVERAGWATTVQDGGRHGYAHLGVPTAGAVDPGRLALLNRLVGNEPAAAGLETAGGLVVRATTAVVLATSGEMLARSVRAAEVVAIDPAPGDLYGYLAVRGGIAVVAVLGSRSRDTLAGVGPPAITDGTELPLGADPGTPLATELAPARPRPDVIVVWPGPRKDWFRTGALERFVAATWTVSGDVSRVGARLDGPPIERTRHHELPSEGLVLGAVQIPPDGRPVVMLADHPTTGGYPVLAVVDPAAVATFAQRRRGAAVRFRLHPDAARVQVAFGDGSE